MRVADGQKLDDQRLTALDLDSDFLTALLAVVLYDFGGYASHRLLHRFEWAWRVHKVHHSSRSLDWLATFRAHVLEHTLRHLASPVVLILLGFPAFAVAIAGVVYASFAAAGHSNLRVDLSSLEPLFVTPRLHRLHHVPATSEKNFGTIFSLWDRLARTLVTSERGGLEPLGVAGEVETYPQTWWRQLVEPFRGAALPAAALPAWLPEGVAPLAGAPPALAAASAVVPASGPVSLSVSDVAGGSDCFRDGAARAPRVGPPAPARTRRD